GVFLDQSRRDDGGRNVELVCEKGREVIYGIYKGMSPLPEMWKSVGNTNDIFLSDKRDIASFEVMKSRGIHISNPTTSIW
ncbi:hypothetical protein M3M33_16740, partial [Loigolactobacillus coryniformis]|uniref:hypothetical protein n=1 Tax=Loigolactobacillus coryniformis TaxID=1610 RepID=UPI00201B0889